MVAVVTAFGLAAGWMVLRRENVTGAIIAHGSMNFLIFLFIGGTISRL